MKSDEQPQTTSETPPSPQESVKETETAKVTPLIPEEVPKAKETNTPGVFVLQWLTYAFWGWMIVGVAYLVSLTAGFILEGERFESSIQEPVAYGIAAVLVLLPVALLCDIFYSRLEAEHKKGASSVIMVIHAVLFALLGIGTLIAIAFSLVNMFLSGYRTGPQVVLITSLVMFALYMLTLVRTVRPFIARKFRLIFRIVMSLIVLGACVWGIVGPVAAAARTKDDRAVNQALTTLNTSINAYVSNKDTLPKDINEVITAKEGYYSAQDWGSIKDLANRGLVTYTPNTKAPTDDDLLAPDISMDSSSSSIIKNPSSKTYYYEICGTYKYEGTDDSYRAYPASDSNEYLTYLPGTSHGAGKNCYKLKTAHYIPY
jgi:hypothetical protein